MATNLQTDSRQGVGELVSGIVQDAQELVSQQLSLFKHELRQDFRNARDGLCILAGATTVLLVASLLLGLMLVHLVQWLAPTWPLWVCYALIGGVFAVIGSALAYVGYEKLRSRNILPDESAKALEESLEWKTKPT